MRWHFSRVYCVRNTWELVVPLQQKSGYGNYRTPQATIHEDNYSRQWFDPAVPRHTRALLPVTSNESDAQHWAEGLLVGTGIAAERAYKRQRHLIGPAGPSSVTCQLVWRAAPAGKAKHKTRLS